MLGRSRSRRGRRSRGGLRSTGGGRGARSRCGHRCAGGDASRRRQGLRLPRRRDGRVPVRKLTVAGPGGLTIGRGVRDEAGVVLAYVGVSHEGVDGGVDRHGQWVRRSRTLRGARGRVEADHLLLRSARAHGSRSGGQGS